MGGAFLVNGNSRGETFDVIYVGFLHLAEELTGISRQRLNIASLTFGKDGIERQGGFARAGETRDNHQFVTRDFYGDILEIVFACTNHADDVR
jgi:hypothetical protein